MNKLNGAAGEISGMSDRHSVSPVLEHEQGFGYVRPHRVHKSGKRMFFYRLPSGDRKWAISKTLVFVFVLVLLLAVFIAGFVNGRHASNQSGGRTLPTAAVPANTFHRLITISAVRGATNSPGNIVSRKLVHAENPFRTDLGPQKYLSAR
jgi:hypothetical protein